MHNILDALGPCSVSGSRTESRTPKCSILLRCQLLWTGHVRRMDDCRLLKRLLYAELSTGERSLDRPKMPYKDTLKHCGIHLFTWKESAEDCAIWRSLVKFGVSDFEAKRIRDKEQIRKKKKDQEGFAS